MGGWPRQAVSRPHPVLIVGFGHREDAGRFPGELRGRFAEFGLELHPGRTRHWHRALRRRSHKTRLTRARMNRIVTRWLPPTRIMNPFPDARFAGTNLRQQPSAVIPHAGICAGGHREGGPYRDWIDGSMCESTTIMD